MKPQKSAVQLLILAEVIALIAVIIFGIVHGGRVTAQSNDTGQVSYEDLWVSTEPESPSEEAEMTDDAAIQNELQPAVFSEEVKAKLAAMTIEEKVAQMFWITPEALTHMDVVTVSRDGTREAIEAYPVGGLVYSAQNFLGRQQTILMLSGVQGYSIDRIGLPIFLGVEEAGGVEYSPLAAGLSLPIQESPAELGEEGNPQEAAAAAGEIASYLAELGFNMNFAPSADLAGGTDAARDGRTYGFLAPVTAQMVEGSIHAYHANGVGTVTGSFPGKGMGNTNTKDWSEWQAGDRLSYVAAVQSESDCIMLGNVICEAITGDATTPCSLSAEAVNYLRNELGYTGILVTDDLSESMITESYSSGEAAVAAVKAGVNILFCPEDFPEAYAAVMEAVERGEISSETVDQAAGYILTRKLAMQNGDQE